MVAHQHHPVTDSELNYSPRAVRDNLRATKNRNGRNSSRGPSALLDRLPDLIWCRVWAFLPMQDCVSVSHVSSRWRTVALHCPHLWNWIELGTSSALAASSLEITLERGGDKDLFALELGAAVDSRMLQTFLGLLQSRSHRMHSLHAQQMQDVPLLRSFIANLDLLMRKLYGSSEVGTKQRILRSSTLVLAEMHLPARFFRDWTWSHPGQRFFCSVMDLSCAEFGTLDEICSAMSFCPTVRTLSGRLGDENPRRQGPSNTFDNNGVEPLLDRCKKLTSRSLRSVKFENVSCMWQLYVLNGFEFRFLDELVLDLCEVDVADPLDALWSHFFRDLQVRVQLLILRLEKRFVVTTLDGKCARTIKLPASLSLDNALELIRLTLWPVLAAESVWALDLHWTLRRVLLEAPVKSLPINTLTVHWLASDSEDIPDDISETTVELAPGTFPLLPKLYQHGIASRSSNRPMRVPAAALTTWLHYITLATPKRDPFDLRGRLQLVWDGIQVDGSNDELRKLAVQFLRIGSSVVREKWPSVQWLE